MVFNEHWNLVGRHAFLSPSQYHWTNYDLEKLETRFFNSKAAERGTELHEYAAMAIRLGRKQPKNKDTVNMFVNDAIGYMMTPEQPLYYSDNCFGTADAISFTKGTVLRIHDLKTGLTPTSMTQLYIYAALFCLEYGKNPDNIDTFLRIYQSNERIEEDGDPEIIASLMDRIVQFDAFIESLKEGQ